MDFDAVAADWEILCHQCKILRRLCKLWKNQPSYRRFYVLQTGCIAFHLQHPVNELLAN